MGRPRVHDENAILDAAEKLLAGGDPNALTIRSLAKHTGAPSGSLYHAFGSRSGLLGAMWLRGARLFLAHQRRSIEAALAGRGTPRENALAATIAAARTFADLRRERPDTAAFLMSHRRERLLDERLPAELAAALRELDRELLSMLRRLAEALWDRTDRVAVDTVAACVVDLPTALLASRRPRRVDAEHVLAAAVRGIIEHAPPPPPD
jgi:AcrR family transcriptional regulator